MRKCILLFLLLAIIVMASEATASSFLESNVWLNSQRQGRPDVYAFHEKIATSGVIYTIRMEFRKYQTGSTQNPTSMNLDLAMLDPYLMGLNGVWYIDKTDAAIGVLYLKNIMGCFVTAGTDIGWHIYNITNPVISTAPTGVDPTDSTMMAGVGYVNTYSFDTTDMAALRSVNTANVIDNGSSSFTIYRLMPVQTISVAPSYPTPSVVNSFQVYHLMWQTTPYKSIKGIRMSFRTESLNGDQKPLGLDLSTVTEYHNSYDLGIWHMDKSDTSTGTVYFRIPDGMSLAQGTQFNFQLLGITNPVITPIGSLNPGCTATDETLEEGIAYGRMWMFDTDDIATMRALDPDHIWEWGVGPFAEWATKDQGSFIVTAIPPANINDGGFFCQKGQTGMHIENCYNDYTPVIGDKIRIQGTLPREAVGHREIFNATVTLEQSNAPLPKPVYPAGKAILNVDCAAGGATLDGVRVMVSGKPIKMKESNGLYFIHLDTGLPIVWPDGDRGIKLVTHDPAKASAIMAMSYYIGTGVADAAWATPPGAATTQYLPRVWLD